ncbi:hypothetical protein [Conexibacter woesei]|uniref:hypothetical protein n=1 Tax=Conexibacter woesei TaxID=191495 RepID=UPI000416F936|nr:hypothetical protein [Conexibacter woesei]
MRLSRLIPGRAAAAATVGVTPQTVTATDEVRVVVTLPEPIDKVDSAVVELGYGNTYRYRWAGRHDAAAKFDDMSLVTMDQVGTDYGSDRSTSDWVAALNQPLPVAGGTLRAGEHEVRLRVPSWAPGTSRSTVTWEARLRVARPGRDVEAAQPFEVLIAAPDPPPAAMPLIQGTRVMHNSIEWDITTERTCYRPGDVIAGTIALTPREPISRTGELAVYFMTVFTSHPLERTPALDTETQTRPPIKIAEDLQLREGETTTLPFSVTLPDEVDPTTEAVHSSVDVFLLARIMFSGLTGGVESARRGIVVFTAA